MMKTSFVPLHLPEGIHSKGETTSIKKGACHLLISGVAIDSS